MSCSRPLKGFPYGYTNNGKQNFIITSYKVNHIEIRNNKVVQCLSDKIHVGAERYINDFVEIPCGCCMDCKLKKARSWQDRIQMEMKNYKKNCFITLTYDDSNIPKSLGEIVNDDTGEWCLSEERDGKLYSLNFKDLQQFIKSLRQKLYRHKYAELKKKYGYKRGDKELLKKIKQEIKDNYLIKFFACGEYGTNPRSGNLPRPHYHIIVFNYCPDDLEYRETTDLGDILYTSKELDELWHKGLCVIGECTYQSAGYVARYSVKKLNDEMSHTDILERYGMEKEFITMSNGIGLSYYENNKDTVFVNEHIFLPTNKGYKQCKPPRYFKKLLEKENESKYKEITDMNKKYADISKQVLLESTDKKYEDILLQQEKVLNKKTKILKERSKI